jgi:hypothetical protein
MKNFNIMLKISTSILIVFIISLSGCSKNNWSRYWPYSNINPSKVQKQLPNNYEECLNYLDMILKDESKTYFKNQDSTIAVIEICEQIGGFFVTNWYLNYFNNTNSDNNLNALMALPSHAPGVARAFTKAGIGDPEAMIRVVFRCYFKKLNSIEYSWEEEINKMKIDRPYQKDPKLAYQIRKTALEKEWALKNKLFFNRLNKNDSLISFFNNRPRIFNKKPNEFFLVGVVNFKQPETESVNIRLTKVLSNKGTDKISFSERTLQAGDTLSGNVVDWHKKNVKYFNYSENTFYPDKIP